MSQSQKRIRRSCPQPVLKAVSLMPQNILASISFLNFSQCWFGSALSWIMPCKSPPWAGAAFKPSGWGRRDGPISPLSLTVNSNQLLLRQRGLSFNYPKPLQLNGKSLFWYRVIKGSLFWSWGMHLSLPPTPGFSLSFPLFLCFFLSYRRSLNAGMQ